MREKRLILRKLCKNVKKMIYNMKKKSHEDTNRNKKRKWNTSDCSQEYSPEGKYSEINVCNKIE